jgi:hypothetical protein
MKKLIVSFCILLIGSSAFAQEKPSIKVCLSVTGDAKILALTENYIKKELRSLGDITIVDTKYTADYYLVMVIVQEKLKGGSRLEEFTCAWAVAKPMTYGCEDLRGVRLVANSNNLKELCQGIVSEFDVKYLELLRRQKQRKK